MSWTTEARERPCWRCRVKRALRAGRLHFGCRPVPELTYLDV